MLFGKFSGLEMKVVSLPSLFSLVCFKQPTTSLIHFIVFNNDPSPTSNHMSFPQEDEVWRSGRCLELEVKLTSNLLSLLTHTSCLNLSSSHLPQL